jgi:hypothetical protein
MEAQILRNVSDFRRLYVTLHSLRKCKTGFIQGTPVDCLSILLFLGQANVCRLGITLVKKTHHYQDWVVWASNLRWSYFVWNRLRIEWVKAALNIFTQRRICVRFVL